MKPKKYIALFVALIMLGSLVGCGANTSSNAVSPEELEQPDIIIDVTDSKEDSPESTTSNSATETTTTEATTTETTTAETTVEDLTSTEAITTEETSTEATTTEATTTTEETTEMTTENTVEATYRKYSAIPEFVKLIGRTYLDDEDVLWIPQSAGGIEFLANGSDLRITLAGDNSATPFSDSAVRYAIYINGERVADKMMKSSDLTLGINLPEGENTVKFVKLSESANGIIGIKHISILSTQDITPTPESSLKIEFIGDSITCGYGVDDENREHHFSTETENATKTFAYKAAQILGADYSMVCYSGHGIISAYTGDGKINESGLVPKIYTQVGKTWDHSFKVNVNELEWDFDGFDADIVVINLGTNDNSYVNGDADRAKEFEAGYVDFLKLIRKNNPNAHIVCALGIMGADLYSSVEAAAETFTKETGDDNISCLKFGTIMGNEGYSADWHPTEATQTRCADELIQHLITISDEAKALYEANN